MTTPTTDSKTWDRDADGAPTCPSPLCRQSGWSIIHTPDCDLDIWDEEPDVILESGHDSDD